MSGDTCPELEVLFAELAEGQGPHLEHAKSCPACSAIVEEHRQMEKDLFRLADPLPPPDFTLQVMAKVRAAPAPVSSELKVGAGILTTTFGLLLALYLARGGGLAGIGAGIAGIVVRARPMMLGLSEAIAIIWRTGAIPVAIGLTLLLTLSLLGLKRLAGSHPLADAKVTP